MGRYEYWVEQQLEPDMALLRASNYKRFKPQAPRVLTGAEKLLVEIDHRTERELQERENAFLAKHGIIF